MPTSKKLWTLYWKVNINVVINASVEIYMVQSELVKKGKKRPETLRISEEEIMLNNHRCCY